MKDSECGTDHYLVMLTVNCGKIDMEGKDENENENEPGVHMEWQVLYEKVLEVRFSSQ